MEEEKQESAYEDLTVDADMTVKALAEPVNAQVVFEYFKSKEICDQPNLFGDVSARPGTVQISHWKYESGNITEKMKQKYDKYDLLFKDVLKEFSEFYKNEVFANTDVNTLSDQEIIKCLDRFRLQNQFHIRSKPHIFVGDKTTEEDIYELLFHLGVVSHCFKKKQFTASRELLIVQYATIAPNYSHKVLN